MSRRGGEFGVYGGNDGIPSYTGLLPNFGDGKFSIAQLTASQLKCTIPSTNVCRNEIWISGGPVKVSDETRKKVRRSGSGHAANTLKLACSEVCDGTDLAEF